jgi:cob(I)alamin adenosyltransferase
VRIYTRDGDDGTTGLYFGGRVAKDSEQIAVNGAVDEAQAALGWARALAEKSSRLDEILIGVERDLWVLMSEVATAPENRRKLKPGKTLVTAEMVSALETTIDELADQTEMPKDFVVPGETQLSAALDVARTVIRRAERIAVAHRIDGSEVLAYLNRLSDLVWAMARFVEGSHHRLARQRG